MLYFILKSFKNRKIFSALFIAAIAMILLVLPFSLTALKQNFTQIQANIVKHSRGSYDILVRPQGARNEIEKKLGVVEENYLSVGAGGISIKQWKEIQNLGKVSVAAPVAAIGYFTGGSKSFSLPMPDGPIRSSAQMYTSNGVRKFPVGPLKQIIFLNRSKPYDDGIRFVRMPGKNLTGGSSRMPPAYLLPETYHLLAGINPKSEAKISGLSFGEFSHSLSARQERWCNRQFPGAPIVKILKLKDPAVPVYARAERDFLNIFPEKTAALKKKYGLASFEYLARALASDENRKQDRKKYFKMFDHLLEYPVENTRVFHLDFSGKLDPFLSESLRVNRKGIIVKNKKYGIRFNKSGATIHYLASDIGYQMVKKHQLLVPKLGERSGVPVYRTLHKEGKRIGWYEGTPPFCKVVVGAFQIGNKENRLAASPLGIYSLTPTVLASSGEKLHATIYPGSFVSAPAHGVTTIKSAKVIKGDKPIDAIRVRVAEIDGYTEAAAEKIKGVAEKISEMGFEVDIVAGASHQQMKVKVEGIGTVLEPWTTLGVAATIVNGWNGTTVILVVSFVLVALIYLLGRILFAKVERQEEVALLSQLGWDRKHIARKMRAESVLLTVVALAVAAGGALLLQGRIDVPGYVYWLQLVLFVVLAGFFMAALRGKTVKAQSGSAISNRMSEQPGHFIRKNIRFYRRYIRLPFIQLVVVSALSTFVFLAIRATINQTDLTVLGQYVNLQASSFYKWIIAGAYGLALFTVAEALTSLLQVRRRELMIFQSIGWEFRHIYRLLLAEIVCWTGIATGSGAVLSFIGFVFLYGFSVSSIWVILLSFAALYAAVLLVASLLLGYQLRKNIGR